MIIDVKESDRQTALLKRLKERADEGSHRGEPNEMLQYCLDECMQIEAETMAALEENVSLKKRVEELEQLLAAANLGWA